MGESNVNQYSINTPPEANSQEKKVLSGFWHVYCKTLSRRSYLSASEEPTSQNDALADRTDTRTGNF